MEHPEFIYWALMCLIALPASLFSRCAGVVFVSWLVRQAMYVYGFQTPHDWWLVYAVSAGLTFWGARSWWCLIVAAAFAPLTVICLFDWLIDPVSVYWIIYWIATVQALVLIMTIDWPAARKVYRAVREHDKYDDLFNRLGWLWAR